MPGRRWGHCLTLSRDRTSLILGSCQLPVGCILTLAFYLCSRKPKVFPDRDFVALSPHDVLTPFQLGTETATAQHDVSASHAIAKGLLLTLIRRQVPVRYRPFTTTTISPAEQAWIFDPGQFMAQGYTPADGSATGQIAAEYGADFFDVSGPASNRSCVSLDPWQHGSAR